MSFLKFSDRYKGNLLQFLDQTTSSFNKSWATQESEIKALKDKVMATIEKLVRVFGSPENVARKFQNGERNKQFNRVLLEVLVFYFSEMDEVVLTPDNNQNFLNEYARLFETDPEFQATIDGSTKNMDKYRIRYSRIQDIVNEAYSVNLISPFKYVGRRTKE